jgi:hypothetical protein
MNRRNFFTRFTSVIAGAIVATRLAKKQKTLTDSYRKWFEQTPTPEGTITTTPTPEGVTYWVQNGQITEVCNVWADGKLLTRVHSAKNLKHDQYHVDLKSGVFTFAGTRV